MINTQWHFKLLCCWSFWHTRQFFSADPPTPLFHIPETGMPSLRGGADKSSAQPGRKATATKLGIYSTYSTWSSIYFLPCRSNLGKPNMGTFQLFSVHGTGGSPMGPDPENRVGDQDSGSPGRPVSSGLQVPSELGHCHARTRTPWWPSAAFFLQNVLQLHQQRWVLLRIESLALWKIINEEDAILIQKNRDENFSGGFLHSEYLGLGEPLCRHSIDCCFVSWS